MKTIQIVIKEPVPFYSELDEDHFFGWLKSIPGVKSVNGTSKGLELTLNDPIDKPSLYEIIALMTRYKLNQKCLRVLCSSNNEAWFKNKAMYWYQSIFEDP